MNRDDPSSLEQIIWEIRRTALCEGDALQIDSAILALADCLHRRADLDDDDRSAIMQAAALLWRAGFNHARTRETGAATAH